MEGMKNVAMEVAMLTLINFQEGSCVEDLIDVQCEYLKNKCLLTDDEVELYKEFTCRVAVLCSDMSEEEIHDYANELNTIIQESNLPQEIKEEIAASALTTINSALCWQQ